MKKRRFIKFVCTRFCREETLGLLLLATRCFIEPVKLAACMFSALSHCRSASVITMN